MNGIFFAMKRAFHGVLRVTRRPLQLCGLTAARFDMMYAVLQVQRKPGSPYAPSQRELQQALGVSAPTVSRMVRSLEELGYVMRERPKYGDKRLWIVSLTAKGMECIRYAYQALRRSSLRLAALGLVLAPGVREERRGFAELPMLASLLERMRWRYWDGAMLTYSWMPEGPHD
jgi:DNA-binding MarR family transcriptional regulator